MNVINIAGIFLLLRMAHSVGFNFTPAIWKLSAYTPLQSFEQAMVEYFETKTSMLSVAIRLEYSRAWRFVINEYLAKALRGKTTMKVEVFSDGVERKHRMFNYNLWYVDSYKAFRSLLPVVDRNFVEKMGQYMVVLKTPKHLNATEELTRIIREAYERNIVDIVVAYLDIKYKFNLYHYDLFQPQQCRKVLLANFNSFKDGLLKSETLFPIKFRNFHKCPIGFYMRSARPYFSYNLTSDGQQIDYFWGLEAKIAQTMATSLNFELSLQQSQRQLWSGNVYANGTSTGPFKSMAEKKFDILMGYYHFPVRSQYFAASNSYFITSTVVVIRKRKNVQLEGQWLLAPFQTSVWLVIVLMLLFGLALTTAARLVLGSSLALNLTWLDIFGLSLGSSRILSYNLISTNMFQILWILGFLVICATFQGKLYEAFNRKSTSSPLTVQQLIDLNYMFLVKSIYSQDLLDALKIPSQQIIVNDFAHNDDAFELLMNESRPLAVLTNNWQFFTYVATHRLYGKFDMVPRIVVVNQVCAYLRPQSYLIEPTNRVINALHSGGIIGKWIKDIAGTLGTPLELEAGLKRLTKALPKAISFRQQRIVFLSLAMLHAVSFIVFLMEILVEKISAHRHRRAAYSNRMIRVKLSDIKRYRK